MRSDPENKRDYLRVMKKDYLRVMRNAPDKKDYLRVMRSEPDKRDYLRVMRSQPDKRDYLRVMRKRNDGDGQWLTYDDSVDQTSLLNAYNDDTNPEVERP